MDTQRLERAFNTLALMLEVPEEQIVNLRIPFDAIVAKAVSAMKCLQVDRDVLLKERDELAEGKNAAKKELLTLMNEVEHQTRRAEKAEASLPLKRPGSGDPETWLRNLEKRIEAIEERLAAPLDQLAAEEFHKKHFPEFKTGDRVTITEERWYGFHGTIEEIPVGGGKYAMVRKSGYPLSHPPQKILICDLKKGWE